MGVTRKENLTGLDNLTPRVMRRTERRGLRAGAKVTERQAKEDAPKITGRYRRGIQVRAGKRSRLRQSVVVRATAPYSAKIERKYGTIAQALKETEQQIVDAMGDEIGNELNAL